MDQEKKPKHPGRGEKELRWFHEHKAELEAEHAGEWAAIGPDGLVSVGPDLKSVMEEAASKGFPDAIATGIRAKEYQGMNFIGTWRVVK